MSAAYPICEELGLEIYEEEVIDAFPVEQLLKEIKAERDRYRKTLEPLIADLRIMNNDGYWPRLDKVLKRFDENMQAPAATDRREK